MVHSDEVSTAQSSNKVNQPSPSKPSNRTRSLRRFMVRLFRRAQGVLATRHLPRLANRVCHTYLGDERPALQQMCESVLKTRLELNPQQLQHFLHTPMGNALLGHLDRFFHPTGGSSETTEKSAPSHGGPTRRSHPNWRTVLGKIASEPGGISLLSVLRHWPNTLQVNIDRVLSTAQHIDQVLQEHEQVMATLEAASVDEASQGPIPNFAQLPNLSEAGEFEVQCHRLNVPQPPVHSVMQLTGPIATLIHQQRPHRKISILLYRPVPWPQKAVPVVIGSHGLASAPDDLTDYACHLASHGYVIALPQHPGSDITHVQRMLRGETDTVFDPAEFVLRPLDVTEVLNVLEARNHQDYGDRLNTRQVGVMGASFGAYTALMLAGGTVQWESLEQSCNMGHAEPNLSLLLQCRALNLPQISYQLRDPRVAAIITLDAVGRGVFGQEGLDAIRVPVMLLAGSEDTAAPLSLEQWRLFQNLKTPNRYLGVIQGKSHIRSWERWRTSLGLNLQICPPPPSSHTTLFDNYIKALNLAFFDTHLVGNTRASAYLHAAYGHYLSQPPFNMLFLKGGESVGHGNITE